MNLTKLREKRAAGENGFTLIELLVVVVIIGILIAIAIPVYLNYKKGASDKSAQSDLRNAMNTLEQCNTDNNSYPTAFASAGALTGCANQTVKSSAGTTFSYFPGSASPPTTYLLLAYNTNGNGSVSGTNLNYYCYSSVAGGSIVTKTSTAPTAYAAAC
jgi:type IV pilus assembly protein PilA